VPPWTATKKPSAIEFQAVRGRRRWIAFGLFFLLFRTVLSAEDGTMSMDPIELPIDGTLDLHTFKPGDVKELVPDYLAACREKGILTVRVIHGKGTGALRRTVHAVLDRLPEVTSYHPAADASSWGATIVHLCPDTSSTGG
jgi:hypothetical protein